MPPAEHPAGIVVAAGGEAGLHEREADEIELCVAAADPFQFINDGFQCIDRGGEVLLFECGEGARYRGHA